MDNIYYTDNYPIEGCTVKINASERQGVFIVSIYAPKIQGGLRLSVYYSMTLPQALNAAECLLKGDMVPKLPSSAAGLNALLFAL